MLKTYVSSIKSIYKTLSTAQSTLLLTIREVTCSPLFTVPQTDRSKLCAPAGHSSVEQLIEGTLNEHVAYQTKPLDLRNQRIYCVRVCTPGLSYSYLLTRSRLASIVSLMSQGRLTKKLIQMLLIL